VYIRTVVSCGFCYIAVLCVQLRFVDCFNKRKKKMFSNLLDQFDGLMVPRSGRFDHHRIEDVGIRQTAVLIGSSCSAAAPLFSLL